MAQGTQQICQVGTIRCSEQYSIDTCLVYLPTNSKVVSQLTEYI